MQGVLISKSFIIREALDAFFCNKFEKLNMRIFKDLNEIKNIELSKIEFMIIDIQNNTMDKISLIKEKFPDMKIMILDKYSNKDIFLKSINNNIDAYITDMPEKEDLVHVIKKVFRGKKYYDMDLLNDVMFNQNNKKCNELDMLTSREIEVLEKVGQGLTNKEIAQHLYVTEHTIKKHITNLLNKLDMNSRKDLIIYKNNIRLA